MIAEAPIIKTRTPKTPRRRGVWQPSRRSDDEAAALFMTVLPMIRYVARRAYRTFEGLCRRVRLDEEDLAQVAAIGALYAAKAFDPSRGKAYATLAFESSRHAITGHLAAYRTCRRDARRKCSLGLDPAAPDVDLEDVLDAGEIEERLTSAQLTPVERNVVLLVKGQGLSLIEAAAECGQHGRKDWTRDKIDNAKAKFCSDRVRRQVGVERARRRWRGERGYQ